MKKQNKNNKNIIKTIKILTIILLIVLISMIGFFGIYKQNKNQMSNIVKDYTYAMDINGARTLKLTLNSENGDDVKTAENYEIAKTIIEKRLKKLDVQEYKIGVNEQTGEITVQIPENTQTDEIISNLTTIGKFEIIDSETKDVLLDNSSIKSSKVLYNTTTSGTSVYLEIAFDKNGKNKLKEISQEYVENHDEENNAEAENNIEETNTESNEVTNETENNSTENTTTESSSSEEKTITMKIDDEEIMTTHFDEPITTGKIQLSVGSSATDSETFQKYVKQARNMATVLDSGKLPVKYDVEKNQYLLSNISKQDLLYVEIALAIVTIVGIIVLTIRFKTNGLLAGISYIGLAAIYLILIRYANVTMSIASIFAIAIVLILNYIFTMMLLSNIKKSDNENKAIAETYKKFFIRIIPICIIVITFCFAKWVPMNTFGMTAFWGIAIIAVYNAIITNTLLKIKNK